MSPDDAGLGPGGGKVVGVDPSNFDKLLLSPGRLPNGSAEAGLNPGLAGVIQLSRSPNMELDVNRWFPENQPGWSAELACSALVRADSCCWFCRSAYRSQAVICFG